MLPLSSAATVAAVLVVAAAVAVTTTTATTMEMWREREQQYHLESLKWISPDATSVTSGSIVSFVIVRSHCRHSLVIHHYYCYSKRNTRKKRSVFGLSFVCRIVYKYPCVFAVKWDGTANVVVVRNKWMKCLCCLVFLVSLSRLIPIESGRGI